VDAIDFLTGTALVREGDEAVIAYEGPELVRGGGRCMTMPVCRDDIW
jgi:arginine deiminase